MPRNISPASISASIIGSTFGLMQSSKLSDVWCLQAHNRTLIFHPKSSAYSVFRNADGPGSGKSLLTRKEAAILEFIANSEERCATRKQLAIEVWRYSADAHSHTIETTMYRLMGNLTDSITSKILTDRTTRQNAGQQINETTSNGYELTGMLSQNKEKEAKK